MINWFYHGYKKYIHYGTKKKLYLTIFKARLENVFRATHRSFDTANEAIEYGKRLDERIKRLSAS